MAGITQLASPADFAGGWWLDWAEDPDALLGTVLARQGAVTDMRPLRQHPLASDRRVDGVAYVLPQTTVTVNPNGPSARIRLCSQVDFDCDLCEGDGLLVAAVDSEAQPSPNTAPIHLVFSTPVKAVGTRVAGAGLRATGGDFDAVLWVKCDGAADWEPPLTTHGRLGTVVIGGTATAPFIGAKAEGGASIREARLTISTGRGRRFDSIAVCPLHGIT
ncbi:hypothetical protein [Siccirubricoccus sp. G192]|uniref:hypothetical protein n=1 Tax=Siccirubricoccus sp. G192 TaxID=2849651 RepID=UPI001C2BD309|nr:hypothetical protein [Siccirubricoccus sp. G192]MBV1796528.1 hypothetical protein [Siccirubricoccus sp. G192]